MCNRFDEDMGHLFLKCKDMRLCWLLLNLEEIRLSLLSLNSAKEMLQSIWGFEKETQQKIILLLWCWWSMRNKVNAGERKKSPQEVTNDVLYYLNAWKLAHMKGVDLAKPVNILRWKGPPEGVYKINCDGAFLHESGKSGWGFIIRDNTGEMVVARAGDAESLMNAQYAETVACLKGIEYAESLGIERIIVETDATTVVDTINNPDSDRSPLTMMFREIRAKLLYDFSFSSVSHCPRACNSIAHILAAIGLNGNSEHLIWQESVPEHVSVLVSSEKAGLCA
jgi:hypothetical protein